MTVAPEPSVTVSVCKDATYSLQMSLGAVCGGQGCAPQGTVCPSAGNVPIQGCNPSVPSWNPLTQSCAAHENAICALVIGTPQMGGTWGCVFPSQGCQTIPSAPSPSPGSWPLFVAGDTSYMVSASSQTQLCGGSGTCAPQGSLCPSKGMTVAPNRACNASMPSWNATLNTCISPANATCAFASNVWQCQYPAEVYLTTSMPTSSPTTAVVQTNVPSSTSPNNNVIAAGEYANVCCSCTKHNFCQFYTNATPTPSNEYDSHTHHHSNSTTILDASVYNFDSISNAVKHNCDNDRTSHHNDECTVPSSNGNFNCNTRLHDSSKCIHTSTKFDLADTFYNVPAKYNDDDLSHNDKSNHLDPSNIDDPTSDDNRDNNTKTDNCKHVNNHTSDPNSCCCYRANLNGPDDMATFGHTNSKQWDTIDHHNSHTTNEYSPNDDNGDSTIDVYPSIRDTSHHYHLVTSALDLFTHNHRDGDAHTLFDIPRDDDVRDDFNTHSHHRQHYLRAKYDDINPNKLSHNIQYSPYNNPNHYHATNSYKCLHDSSNLDASSANAASKHNDSSHHHCIPHHNYSPGHTANTSANHIYPRATNYVNYSATIYTITNDNRRSDNNQGAAHDSSPDGATIYTSTNNNRRTDNNQGALSDHDSSPDGATNYTSTNDNRRSDNNQGAAHDSSPDGATIYTSTNNNRRTDNNQGAL
ncbi:hypothetical protein As57867_005230, partial [Aphanomyces stellatus]